MLCILYVIAVGTALAVAGLLVERALPSTWARRWVWCVIIPISIFLPGIYRTQHNWSVNDVAGQHAAGSGLSKTLGLPAITALDTGFWQRVDSLDGMINRAWLIASGMLLIWGLTNAGRVSLILRSSRRKRREPLIVDGVPVLVTDAIGPATVGVWRSRVLLPRWVLALPGVQRQYVVRHEEEHRKANDSRLLFVASLTLLLMPWNLALWWLLRRLRLAVEMDCDNRVVTALGDANAYGELLLKVAQAASRGPRLQPALLGGVGMLEQRLTLMLAPTPLRHVQRFLLPAVAIGLLFGVLAMPHPVVGSGSHATVTTASGAATTDHSLHPATE